MARSIARAHFTTPYLKKAAPTSPTVSTAGAPRRASAPGRRSERLSGMGPDDRASSNSAVLPGAREELRFDSKTAM
jgi:hypothetical protein